MGKVRVAYSLPDNERLFITTDRLSAFDQIVAVVPYKGQVLNQLAAWWFANTTDIIGNPHASVIDAPATIGSADGKSVVIYAWYDNEFGYSHQVIRLAKYISKVQRYAYY